MAPLTRKQVAGLYLNEIDAGERSWSRKAIEGIDYPPGASDGWHKRYCVSGAGLMNFTVMGDSGARSLTVHCGCSVQLLCSVVQCSGCSCHSACALIQAH